MGGIGSGTWYRWNSKTTTEEVDRVDIRYLRKIGVLEGGSSSGTLYWSKGEEQTGSVQYRLQQDCLVLMYKYRQMGEEWEHVEESILLDRTSCNYGGVRFWFLCPLCGKRVAVLYGAGPRFLCRHCYDLPYASQSESDTDRMMRKARKIRKQLEAAVDLTELIWDKPKGMHWSTFNRLVAKEHLANTAVTQLMMKRFAGY